jgi:hypothetical protein
MYLFWLSRTTRICPKYLGRAVTSPGYQRRTKTCHLSNWEELRPAPITQREPRPVMITCDELRLFINDPWRAETCHDYLG